MKETEEFALSVIYYNKSDYSWKYANRQCCALPQSLTDRGQRHNKMVSNAYTKEEQRMQQLVEKLVEVCCRDVVTPLTSWFRFMLTA